MLIKMELEIATNVPAIENGHRLYFAHMECLCANHHKVPRKRGTTTRALTAWTLTVG